LIQSARVPLRLPTTRNTEVAYVDGPYWQAFF
jgi:hypothetical protein